MNTKRKGKKLINTRTILIILLAVCVVAVAYILITADSGDSQEIFTVKKVIEKSDELIESQEEITVVGYYNYFDENTAEVTDTQILPNAPLPQHKLLVDYSGVENPPALNTGNAKYFFTGILEKDNQNPDLLRLIATKIKT